MYKKGPSAQADATTILRKRQREDEREVEKEDDWEVWEVKKDEVKV